MTWFSKRRSAAIAAVAAFGLVLSGCANGAENSAPAESSEASNSNAEHSFIYVTSDPIGQNEFLKSGQKGIEAVAATHNGTHKTFQSKDDATRRSNLEQAISEQPDLVVMIGFQFTDIAVELAKQNPDQKLLLIDAAPEGEKPANLYTATFREQEPSYLLGVEAALLTEAKKVGTMQSLDIPSLAKFTNGFQQGVKATDGAVEVVAPQFIGGENPFADTARGKEQAIAYAATGVDQVYAIGAASNGGIFEAAKEKGFKAYGVDQNQCQLVPGSVIDGTVKSVNKVIERVVAEILDGKSAAEATSSFGLAEEGMTIVSLDEGAAESGCVIMEHPEILKQVSEAADKIKSGEITVTE